MTIYRTLADRPKEPPVPPPWKEPLWRRFHKWARDPNSMGGLGGLYQLMGITIGVLAFLVVFAAILTEEDGHRILIECEAYNHPLSLLVALSAKGITPPATAKN